MKTGFELKGHLGWVASHSSAEAIHATPDSSFVGYAFKTISETGPDYLYFDRYPLIFSAVTNILLKPFESNLGNWILASKFFMNTIYFLTGVVIFLIAGIFVNDRWKQISIALLALGGEYFITYRSMYHFDQPAMLAQAFLIYCILRMELKGDRKLFYLGSFLSPLMGRGYVSIFTLVLYFGMRMIYSGKDRRSEFFKLSLKTLLPSALLCSGFLAFNIYTEAKIRNVQIQEVSIVKSAMTRLGIIGIQNQETENSLGFTAVVSTQWTRFCRHLIPYSVGRTAGVVLTILLLTFFFWFCFKTYKSGDSTMAFMLIFLALTGPVWVFPMKRLTHFHDYTAMYFWATGLSIYIALFMKLPQRKWICGLVVIAFLSSVSAWFIKTNKSTVAVNDLGNEFSEVRKSLEQYPVEHLHVDGSITNFLPQKPYILGFYFFDRFLTQDQKLSKITISTRDLDLRNIYRGKTLRLYIRE